MATKLFLYRNCFTGDVSGGDMHSSGFVEWLVAGHPEAQVFLIAAKDDGQEAVYPDVAKMGRLSYRAPRFQLPALLYFFRAIQTIFRVRLPWGTESNDKNIVVASSHFLPDVLPAFFAKPKKRPVTKVVYIHHIVQDMPRSGGPNTWLANLQETLCFWLIKKRFDKVIVVNHDVATQLKKRGFRRQQILVSSNFVSLPTGVTLSAKPWAKKDITLVMCGRLVPQKGVDDFVRICESLQAQLPNFSAVMIGEGPEKTRLRALVKRKKLNVRVAGYVETPEKFDLVSRAKLFVFPSIEEGWGIVIAEALTMGTPVLAYKLPVYKQIFDDHLQLVPLHERQQLAESSLRALQTYAAHPARYAALQKQIMLFAGRFLVDHVARSEYRFMVEEQR